MPDATAQPDAEPRTRSITRWFPALIVLAAFVVAPFVRADGASEAGPTDDTLRQGAEVYSAVCSACHQPGGAGLPGSFPPLIDNPNIDDTAYVEDVIANGLTGEITVNGEVYNGVMPAQSTLSDADTAAVIAYIQAGFSAPAAPAADGEATGPAAGTDLPLLADSTMYIAFAIALGLGALVMGPRIIAVIDRREVSWLDAWMKTGVIVIVAIVGTVIVPAKVIELEAVQDLSRNARDLIVVGIWSVALAGLLLGLWFAHRERRI